MFRTYIWDDCQSNLTVPGLVNGSYLNIQVALIKKEISY